MTHLELENLVSEYLEGRLAPARNTQVAEHLVISLRTVTTHLTSIYNKLGVSSRAAATRFAVESRLV